MIFSLLKRLREREVSREGKNASSGFLLIWNDFEETHFFQFRREKKVETQKEFPKGKKFLEWEGSNATICHHVMQ